MGVAMYEIFKPKLVSAKEAVSHIKSGKKSDSLTVTVVFRTILQSLVKISSV